MKVCTKCKVEKELIEFSKNKNGKNGLQSACKMCDKQWRLDNSDELKQYRLDNLDKRKESTKQWYLNNPEYRKKYNKKYSSENKDKINNLYKKLKAKKHISELVDNCFNLISNSISELNFYDIHLEITKANLIKITTLYDDNKILIMSKEVSETGTDIIYSYFINKQLIASDVAEIKEFTEKFKEYLSL